MTACTSFGTQEGAGDDAAAPTPDGSSADGAADASASCGAALATDPSNCGACAHDCRGSACANGMCEKKPLGVSTTAPRELAAGSGRLLWTDGTSIYTCPLPDCQAQTTVPSSSEPIHVAITPSRLYWSRVASLDWVEVHGDGTVGNPSSIGATGIAGIAAHDDEVLYAETDKIKVASPSRTGEAVIGIPTPNVALVAVAGSVLSFTRTNGAISAFDWNSALKQSLPAGSELAGTGRLNAVVSIAVQGADHVYWAANEGIGRTARSTKEVITLAPGVKTQRMVVDDTHVYATTIDGDVVRYDLEGRDRLVLARSTGAFGIAVDASFVYFGDATGVWRVGK